MWEWMLYERGICILCNLSSSNSEQIYFFYHYIHKYIFSIMFDILNVLIVFNDGLCVSNLDLCMRNFWCVTIIMGRDRIFHKLFFQNVTTSYIWVERVSMLVGMGWYRGNENLPNISNVVSSIGLMGKRSILQYVVYAWDISVMTIVFMLTLCARVEADSSLC